MRGRSRRSGRSGAAASARSARSARSRSCCRPLAVGFLLDAEGRPVAVLGLPAVPDGDRLVVTATIPRRGAGTTRSVNLLRGAGGFLASAVRSLLFFVGVHGRLGGARRGERLLLDPGRGPRRQPGPGRHRVGHRSVHRGPVHVRLPAHRRAVSARSDWSSPARWPSPSAQLLAAFAADPVALVLLAPLEGLGFACVFVGGVTVVAARAPAGLERDRPGPVRGLHRAGHDHRLARSAARSPARSGSAGCSRCRGVELAGAGMLALALLRPRPRSDAARPVPPAAT